MRLGLVAKDGQFYKVEHETTQAIDYLSSDAIKNIHHQILSKAQGRD